MAKGRGGGGAGGSDAEKAHAGQLELIEPHDDGTRYVLCPLGPWKHRYPVATRIKRDGKKGWPTIRCVCGFRAFLPKDFKVEDGYTKQYAEEVLRAVISEI